MKNYDFKFEIDTNIYPREAVLNACYCFTNKIYIYLDSFKKNKITIFLKNKTRRSSKKTLTLIKDEFLNELLYATLRHNISRNNKKLREYIIGRALYSPNILPESASDNFKEDPLEIAVDWEDKYGKRK